MYKVEATIVAICCAGCAAIGGIGGVAGALMWFKAINCATGTVTMGILG